MADNFGMNQKLWTIFAEETEKDKKNECTCFDHVFVFFRHFLWRFFAEKLEISSVKNPVFFAQNGKF